MSKQAPTVSILPTTTTTATAKGKAYQAAPLHQGLLPLLMYTGFRYCIHCLIGPRAPPFLAPPLLLPLHHPPTSTPPPHPILSWK
jgi:hypothetical protein